MPGRTLPAGVWGPHMEVVELVNATEYNIFYQSSFPVIHKVGNFVQFKFENKLAIAIVTSI